MRQPPRTHKPEAAEPSTPHLQTCYASAPKGCRSYVHSRSVWFQTDLSVRSVGNSWGPYSSSPPQRLPRRRCTARHGVGSKAEPVALIAECSVALTPPSPLLRLPLRRLCVGRHLAVSPLVLKGVIHTGIPVAVFTHAAVLHHTSPLVSIFVNETPGK